MLSSSDPTSPDRQTDLDEEDILSGPIEDGEYSEREHWERGFWGSKPDLKNILTPEEEMKIRSLLTSEPATYLFATSSAPASAKERQARWRIRKQYKLDEKDRLMRLTTLHQHHDGEEKRAAYLPVVTTSTIFNELAKINETIDHAGANKTWSCVVESLTGASQSVVRVLINTCPTCAFIRTSKKQRYVTPIVQNRTLGLLQIDLIDMRSQADGRWNC